MNNPSPRLIARLAGVFYLCVFGSAFGEIVRSKLTVHGDAAATAHNILASESLFRLGFAASLFGVASYVVVTLLLYVLLKPVNKNVSLLAAFFSLMGIAVLSVACLGYYAPLVFLGGAHYLNAFSAAQLQAAALTSLTLYANCYLIAMGFFGCYCILLGYLIFRSTFMPRTIGVLLLIAGASYLVNDALIFLAPALSDRLPNFIEVTGLGELALTFWLLVFAVNEQKYAVMVSERS